MTEQNTLKNCWLNNKPVQCVLDDTNEHDCPYANVLQAAGKTKHECKFYQSSSTTPISPAEGEMAELAAKLRRLAPQNPLGTADPTITRAAELLQQQQEEIRRLKAQQTPVLVSERLPEPSTKVLAYYFNDHGNGRTICAIWVPAKSCSDDINDDYDNSDHLEYDETDDCYYWPEGWYETIENWDELGYVKVNEGDVIYWQPLPTWPANPTTTGNK